MSTVTNTLRMTFATSVDGERFTLSITCADPTLKESGGLAKVQTAAAAIINIQPFQDVTLSSFVEADIVVREVTPIDI